MSESYLTCFKGKGIKPKNIVVADDFTRFSGKTILVVNPVDSHSFTRVLEDVLSGIKPLGFRIKRISQVDMSVEYADYKLRVGSYLRIPYAFNMYNGYADKRVSYIVIDGKTNVGAREGYTMGENVYTPSLFSQYNLMHNGVVASVLPHGINPALWYPEGVEKRYDILNIVSGEKRKGIPDFIRMCEEVRKRKPDLKVKLYVYGPRPDVPDWVDVSFGSIPQSDVRKLYSSARLYAYSSYVEGFGMTPLEAMACGTPAITIDAPAMNEYMPEKLTIRVREVKWVEWDKSPNELKMPWHYPDIEHWAQLVYDVLTVKDLYDEAVSLCHETVKNYLTVKHYTALFAEHGIIV